MTPITCPSCGAALPEGAAACAYCGRRVAAAPRAGEGGATRTEPVPAEELAPPRRGRPLLLFLVATAVVLAIGMLALAAFLVLQGTEGHAAPAEHRYEYRVSGSVRNATLTYTNATGGTEQRDVRLPWRQELTLTESDAAYIYIAAMSIEETGTLTCEIHRDGEPWKESTSSGSNVMVTCGGVPDGR